MKAITRNNLAIFLVIFTIIINLFLIFDLQLFYIRAILAFIFIIIVPGLLIMLILRIREVGFWEYFVYIVGLSVAFIMFGGLAVNWTLPFLHITDKPLALYPILICFDIFLLVMGFFAYKRNKDLSFKINLPHFSWLDRIFIVWAFCFPFMAVLGAFILNNFGPNYLTMIMLGMIAVYVLLVVILRDKLNEHVFPFALWMIGLSLLLSFSMRSWYVGGVDFKLEFYLLNLTSGSSLWLMDNFLDAYNACISITLFPAIMTHLSGISPFYFIKVLSFILFSFLSLILYNLFRKSFNKVYSYCSTLFFLFQPLFIEGASIPFRQQVAFLFFGLMLLVFFSKELNKNLKAPLFVLFGFSMIVSHYSTSYIALAIFLLTYVFTSIYKLWENRKVKKGKLKREEKQQFFLTGGLLLLLFVFGFLWYSQVTPTANGLIDFAHKSISNMGQMFSEDVQARGKSPLDEINPFKKSTYSVVELVQDYEDSLLNSSLNSSAGLTSLFPYYPSNMKVKINSKLFSLLIKFNVVLEFFLRLMIITGVVILVFNKVKLKREQKLLYISFFIVLCLLVALPFISIKYDLARIYQQILFMLSPALILGLALIIRGNQSLKFIFLSIILVLYFFYSSGFIYQLTGGQQATMRLNNFGGEYLRYYPFTSEMNSFKWLFASMDYSLRIFGDGYSNIRSYPSRFPFYAPKIQGDIVPAVIPPRAYVYSSYTNLLGFSFRSYNGNLVSFLFPQKFLNENKNKIYNNGGSEIFK